jgi:DNA-binding response OmpR family regulator
MFQILVVDDEPKIVELLQMYLEMQGHQVISAYNGVQAWEKWKTHSIDMVLTDIMMPNMDGYVFAEKIRQESNVPLMFITAKTELTDRVKGLQAGADDYIIKPFEPLEVAARVTANLRRCYGYDDIEKKQELICGNLRFDIESCKLYQGEKIVELTAMEYRILQYFMENQGKVVTKNQIYKAAWEENIFPDDNSIMVAISKLRAKLQDENYHYIQTIRGLGYRMEMQDEKIF